MAYLAGYDFGTLSCRLLIIDAKNGEQVFAMSMKYPNGVIVEHLPGTDVVLESGWCLQDPADYIEVMAELMKAANEVIDLDQVHAIGTDFTNCTVVALGTDGNPLCFDPRYMNKPHAWVKLWKHHAAQPYAARIAAYLKSSEISWYGEYGHSVSSEWLFPKLLQVYEEDVEMYERTDLFLEAADYITYFLTGNLVRNSATLGVNAFYSSDRGLPETEFFDAISSGWGDTINDKLRGVIKPVGSRAGTLTEAAATRLGLRPETIVAVGHGDSEVAATGFGITDQGSMLMVIGTSICFQMMHQEKIEFEGVDAIVRDGMIPGFYAYESGQPAVGDSLEWFVNHLMPEYMGEELRRSGLNKFAYMDREANKLHPGESGLLALDWLNGSRSLIMNSNLRGVLAGLSLTTKPEQIYRSIIEATAFSTKKVLDSYDRAGLTIQKLFATGGLAQKSPFTMQIYADILNREIHVTSIPNSSSLGACICGAVAFEREEGSLDAFKKLCRRLVNYETIIYRPNTTAVKIYAELYEVYDEFYTFMGMSTNLFKSLLEIQNKSKQIYNKKEEK